MCEELREGQGKGGGKKQQRELRAVLSPQDRASRLDRCGIELNGHVWALDWLIRIVRHLLSRPNPTDHLH